MKTGWQRPAWLSWLLVRLVSGAGTVLFLSALVFAATHALPSDPARVILGPEAPEETVRILQRQLGLDRPLPEQYVRWLSAAASGDFGVSLDSRRPVVDLMGGRLASTLLLIALVTLITAPLSLAFGTWLAVHRDSRIDRSAVAFLIGLKAVPVFAVAIGLVMLLSTTVFRLLPAVSLFSPNQPWLPQWRYLVLPVVTLVLSSLPYPIRLVRASMIEVLESDYVVLARLRGIPERRILLRHALPNALVPAVQGFALMLSVMLGGSLLVEVLFNYPGIGSMLHAAVEGRDLPVIQALVLILVVGVVGINLGADVANLLLTPRLRTAVTPRVRPDKAARVSVARAPARMGTVEVR